MTTLLVVRSILVVLGAEGAWRYFAWRFRMTRSDRPLRNLVMGGGLISLTLVLIIVVHSTKLELIDDHDLLDMWMRVAVDIPGIIGLMCIIIPHLRVAKGYSTPRIVLGMVVRVIIGCAVAWLTWKLVFAPPGGGFVT